MAFVIREAVAAGLGVEAASLLEVEGALAAGCPPGTVNKSSPPGLHTWTDHRADNRCFIFESQNASSSTPRPRRIGSWNSRWVRTQTPLPAARFRPPTESTPLTLRFPIKRTHSPRHPRERQHPRRTGPGRRPPLQIHHPIKDPLRRPAHQPSSRRRHDRGAERQHAAVQVRRQFGGGAPARDRRALPPLPLALRPAHPRWVAGTYVYV